MVIKINQQNKELAEWMRTKPEKTDDYFPVPRCLPVRRPICITPRTSVQEIVRILPSMPLHACDKVCVTLKFDDCACCDATVLSAELSKLRRRLVVRLRHMKLQKAHQGRAVTSPVVAAPQVQQHKRLFSSSPCRHGAQIEFETIASDIAHQRQR